MACGIYVVLFNRLDSVIIYTTRILPGREQLLVGCVVLEPSLDVAVDSAPHQGSPVHLGSCQYCRITRAAGLLR